MKIKYYLFSFLFLAAFSLVFMLAKNIFNQSEISVIYTVLCDAFFTSGAVLFCIGALIFAVNEGVFDRLLYGINRFFRLYRKNGSHPGYKEYKEERKGKKIPCLAFVLSGILWMVIASVFLILLESSVS